MAETNSREVNADTEVLNVADDSQEGTEGEDETVIPAVEGEESTTEDGAEKPGESESGESSPAGSTEGDNPPAPAPSNKKEPAPVEGETPREKALRLEVQRLKGERRRTDVQDAVGEAPKTAAAIDPMQELRDLGYSDDEIAKADKLVDVLATKKGYVKAEQTYQTTVNSVVETFIEANPEYKPENDPEDVRWNRFQTILKSGIYDVRGKTPKQLNMIFSKVHSDVIAELGESETKVDTKKQDAQRQKIKSVSHSGGTKTATVPKPKHVIAPEVKGMFKGFTDDDF